MLRQGILLLRERQTGQNGCCYLRQKFQMYSLDSDLSYRCQLEQMKPLEPWLYEAFSPVPGE